MEDYNAIRVCSSTEELSHSGLYNKILKSIRCLIGSQCSVERTGLMWSYFLVLVRTLAAAFWTICSLFIKRADQPPNKALQ